MAITLKAARINKNYSRNEVIRLLQEKGLKLTSNTLASYENNKSTPNIIIGKALAEIYGIAVNDIIFCNYEE